MKAAKFFKAMIAVGIVAVFTTGLVACSGGSSAISATAATVNGTAIPESEVTNTIESVRAQSGLDSEESWGSFLVANSLTPESVREQILDSLIDQQLIKEGASKLDISVDSSEVDSYVDSMKANFDDDAAWNEALEQAGFTEASYRESIEASLLQQEVSAHFEEQAQPSDEEVLESAQNYVTYYDGAKRSSHILFDAADEATAQDVLARIKSGELDFAQAASEYSQDSSSENGGDVGWDRATTFATEYQDALDALEVNQVSELVTSQFGIHIIKCTDKFTAPAELTSLDQIPADFQESIKSMAASIKSTEDQQAWIDELKESADIKINDMPADVPYNIDLTKYQEAADAAAAEAEATADETASTDASATEASASTEGAAADSAGSASADSAGSAAASDASASADAAAASSGSASTN